ncbi:LPS export ABC transporter ATP-binding protein [Pseudomonadales bacterium]|nr:LPS export ABC transporter ATP-binding protein [Pseudomonadales bacterium]MDG1703761.1 LPS export ABC transporter ATP-binding protein [Pseudomonadales bacterium]
MTLSAEKLRKSYSGNRVVEDVSLTIEPGEIVGLLGPNGAGKTTCFYMLVGLVKADSGEVLLDKQTLTNAPMHDRASKGIGYLPQEASVFRTLSTEANIMAMLELNPSLDQKARLLRLETLLDEFGLRDVRHNLGQSLSGGERRRLEIARALASDPKYMLLDEPFAGVDPVSVADIKKEISGLAARGIGILITDHNVRETLDICQRAYIVHQGQVIAQGSPQDVLANTTVQHVYLGKDFA